MYCKFNASLSFRACQSHSSPTPGTDQRASDPRQGLARQSLRSDIGPDDPVSMRHGMWISSCNDQMEILQQSEARTATCACHRAATVNEGRVENIVITRRQPYLARPKCFLMSVLEVGALVDYQLFIAGNKPPLAGSKDSPTRRQKNESAFAILFECREHIVC